MRVLASMTSRIPRKNRKLSKSAESIDQPFTKHDRYKSRLDLLPSKALLYVGHQLGHGARIYAPGNWKKCTDPARYVGAALRHLIKHIDNKFIDQDNGLPHLSAVATNALFALELILNQGQDVATMGNFFALVEKKSRKRGVIRKRWKEYTPAFEYLESHDLDPDKYVIKTVPSSVKVGSTTKV